MNAVLRVTCDRCGDAITEGRCLLSVESGALLKRYQTIDLCGPCAGKLAAWLAAGPSRENTPPERNTR